MKQINKRDARIVIRVLEKREKWVEAGAWVFAVVSRVLRGHCHVP